MHNSDLQTEWFINWCALIHELDWATRICRYITDGNQATWKIWWSWRCGDPGCVGWGNQSLCIWDVEQARCLNWRMVPLNRKDMDANLWWPVDSIDDDWWVWSIFVGKCWDVALREFLKLSFIVTSTNFPLELVRSSNFTCIEFVCVTMKSNFLQHLWRNILMGKFLKDFLSSLRHIPGSSEDKC